jgi:hypothetical protein
MVKRIVLGAAALLALGAGLLTGPEKASADFDCSAFGSCLRMVWDGEITLYQYSNKQYWTQCKPGTGEGNLVLYFYPNDPPNWHGACKDFP